MNLNQESRFGQIPKVQIPRSRFPKSHGHTTTWNAGDLIPLDVQEVVPGSTISFDMGNVIRLQTLIDPVMSNIYFDAYTFFVPMRLVWNHTKEFFGESTTAPWAQTTVYTVPQLESPAGGWTTGTLADYFGVPVGIDGLSVNALPFRAYALICNEWFRYSPVTTPCNVSVDDTTRVGVNTGSYVTATQCGGLPFRVKRLPGDPWSACLPAPQCSANDVTVPLGTTAGVYTGGTDYDFSAFPKDSSNAAYPLHIRKNIDGSKMSGVNTLTVDDGVTYGHSGSVTTGDPGVIPVNLYADLSNATAASINQLRQAFAIQRYYEKLARSGNRYREILMGLYGTTPQDSRMMIPEFLGSSRQVINIHQVVQNSSTVSMAPEMSYEGTPQGTVTAYSQTNGKKHHITHSFQEHGYMITVACCRYDHNFSDGLEPMWTRKEKLDFYAPVFANLGEQSVRLDTIYATGTSADKETFGYNEAWYDYRYQPSRTSGEMRPKASGSLASWHLGDNYTSRPYLDDTWIRESPDNLDRCLAVSHDTANQFFGDFYFHETVTAPMPVNSVPGLIDHF